MPTPSPHLGLLVPARSDPFVTADIATNWDTIDAAPGDFICTSTTRPGWGAGQAGMSIYETDSGLEWRWNGSAFKRTAPVGILGSAIRTTNFSTSSSTYVVVLATPSITVPAGNRTLQVTVSWSAASNDTNNFFSAGVFRSATPATNVVDNWSVIGSPSGSGFLGNSLTTAAGGTQVVYETAGLTAGTYVWSLQIRGATSTASPGVSDIDATGTSPISITVIEV